MKKSKLPSAFFFCPNCDFGNGDLGIRTLNTDQIEIGATILLVATYFLFFRKWKYETSQIKPKVGLIRQVKVGK